MEKPEINFEKFYEEAIELKKARKPYRDWWELFIRAYKQAQEDADIYPTNEDEDLRLIELAGIMWHCGRTYQQKLNNG